MRSGTGRESSGRGFSRQAWFLELGEEQILEVPAFPGHPHQCSVPETASGDDWTPSPSECPPMAALERVTVLFSPSPDCYKSSCTSHLPLASVRQRVKESDFLRVKSGSQIRRQVSALLEPFVRISRKQTACTAIYTLILEGGPISGCWEVPASRHTAFKGEKYICVPAC